MKIIVDRLAFLKAAQICESVIAKRDIKPILQHVKVAVTDDVCTLSAIDLECGVRLTVGGVKIDTPGDAMLPAALLVQICGAASDDELTIEADNDRFTVTGSSTEFEHPAENVATFPDVPAADARPYHELQGGALALAIKRTAYSSGAEENSRFLATSGTSWELGADNVTLVATDGHALASVTLPATRHDEHAAPVGNPLSVPAKAMLLLARLCNGGAVRVAFSANDVCFVTETASVYCRLLEGRFPKWRQHLPKRTNATARITAGVLLGGVRQAAVMTNSDKLTKRVGFAFESGKLTLTATRDSSGRSRAEVPISYDGKPIRTMFAPSILSEFLRVLDGNQELRIELQDGEAPAVFRAGDDYLYVAVPMRVQPGG